MARKKKKKQAVKESLKIEKKVFKPISISKLSLKNLMFVLGFFLLSSFALYFACLDYGFVLDDKIVLSENNYTKNGLSGISDLFSTDSFQGYFGEQKEILQGGRYRPLSLVSFAIEHEFFGLNHWVFHFNNILLYALGIFIAFVCLRRLFKEDHSQVIQIITSFSFLTTVVFLFHPIHTEAVANIKGRDEIMSFVFSMLCLLYALKYYDTQKLKNLILALLFYFLGLFSKENTITFLAVVPFAIFLFRKFHFASMIKIGVSFFVVTIIYLIIRTQALGYLLIDNPSTDIMNNPFVNLSGIERISTIFYTLLVYIKLNFIPIALTHDYYPYHIPIMDLSNWEVWLSIFLHLFMVVAAFYFLKKEKKISFAVGFYIITLSIISNIVVNIGTFMNERFIFTASLGMCLLIVYLIKQISERQKLVKPIISISALCLLVLGLYGFKTIDRVPAWESELSLNKEAVKVSKNSARANSFMATAYFNRYKEISDREEKRELLRLARPHAEKAVEIHPEYYNANLMLAGITAEEYKYDQDLNKFLDLFKSIALSRPDVDYLTTYLKFLNDKGNNLSQLRSFYLDLGKKLYDQKRNYSWSIHYLLLGDRIAPNDPEIRAALVNGYLAIGRKDLADLYR